MMDGAPPETDACDLVSEGGVSSVQSLPSLAPAPQDLGSRKRETLGPLDLAHKKAKLAKEEVFKAALKEVVSLRAKVKEEEARAETYKTEAAQFKEEARQSNDARAAAEAERDAALRAAKSAAVDMDNQKKSLADKEKAMTTLGVPKEVLSNLVSQLDPAIDAFEIKNWLSMSPDEAHAPWVGSEEPLPIEVSDRCLCRQGQGLTYDLALQLLGPFQRNIKDLSTLGYATDVGRARFPAQRFVTKDKGQDRRMLIMMGLKDVDTANDVEEVMQKWCAAEKIPRFSNVVSKAGGGRRPENDGKTYLYITYWKECLPECKGKGRCCHYK